MYSLTILDKMVMAMTWHPCVDAFNVCASHTLYRKILQRDS